MSITYTYNPNWINRDSQPDGSDLRVVRAADFESEWVSIQTAFTKAAPAASPTFTGTATFTDTASFENVTINTSFTAPGYNNSDWDTAFGWGDHSTYGYLTSADAPNTDGTGASGTWGISITGNAATATTASNVTRSVLSGTNITGGGQLSANRTLSLVDSPSVTSLILGNFTLIDNGGTKLYLQYNGINVVAFNSDGTIQAEGNVGAYVNV